VLHVKNYCSDYLIKNTIKFDFGKQKISKKKSASEKIILGTGELGRAANLDSGWSKETVKTNGCKRRLA
jgi:hypothetical protein